MKKICYLTILILIITMVLSGCGESAEPVYDAGQFILSVVEMDGHRFEAASVYPAGAYLLLSADGSGRLILGKEACNVNWQREEGSLSVSIDALTASGTESGGVLTLQMGSTGLVYVFSEGNNAPSHIAEEDAAEENDLQRKWNGVWTGRMWFEEVSGEWADFEDRTMAMEALITLDDEGEGTLVLNNSFYSDSMPMATLSITVADGTMKCESGYFMAFPLQEWGISISRDRELMSEIEDTIILHPNVYEFGHIYFPEETAEDVEADVLRLTGRCENDAGYFRYKIVLTR